MTIKNKRILVIDDDVNIHKIVDKYLGNHKYEVLFASTLSEGLNFIDTYRPSVILLDINIGEESGFEALKRIDIIGNPYIIMMSNDAFGKNVRRSIALGASDFLAKPLVNKIVIQKVRKAFLKMDNELNFYIPTDEESVQWRLTLKVKSCQLDKKTKIIVSDSISDLKEMLVIQDKKYKKLGLPKKLKSGDTKIILSEMEDNIKLRDEFLNNIVSEQEDLLRSSSITISVLDDDPNFLDIVKLFCSKNNIKVQQFTSIEKFKESLAPPLPNLCIVDLSINKPNDAFELIEELSEAFENLPIIAATSNTDGKSSTHAVEIGADDFIYKPIKKNLMMHKILGLVKADELSSIYHRQLLSQSMIEISYVNLDIVIKKIDDLGVEFLSKSQLKLGSCISVKSPKLHQEIKLKITRAEHDNETGRYICYGEFQDLEYRDVILLMEGN